MSVERGFDFRQTRTCVLVGVGASIHLGYPSFAEPGQVSGMFDQALELGNLYQSTLHQENAKKLVSLLGPHFNWNLERIYEHLAHMPPFLYGQQLDSNTDYLCQWLVTTVAERLGAQRTPEQLIPCTQRWLQLVEAKRPPMAFFSTNYDRVLEAALADVNYADGWAEGQYRREHFDAPPSCSYALIKLHGTAG
jgi:hypothetical protein